METIMPPNFMGRAATIIAEVQTRTCMDNIDIEVLKAFLQHALHECYDAGYDAGYGEGYAAGKSILEGDVDNAYDEGYALGYSDGLSKA